MQSTQDEDNVLFPAHNNHKKIGACGNFVVIVVILLQSFITPFRGEPSAKRTEAMKAE
jgi:hypothetical protein